MDIFIAIFAGLALLFVGAKLVGSNVRRVGARRFRAGVGRAVEIPAVIAGLGILLGALMLTANAVTFVCINAVGAGVVKARRILPLLIWSNLGSIALVLIATRDVHLLVLLLLGAVGVLYYFELDKHVRLRHVVAALLGGGLLFFGIDLIREGVQGLRLLGDTQVAVDFTRQHLVLGFVALAFVIGVGVTAAARSSSLVTIVVMVLAEAGLLSLEQGIALVLGAGIGSALALWRTTAKLDGTPRQLAMLEIFTELSGPVVLALVFAAELWSGVPLIRAIVLLISPEIQTELACVYLACQLIDVAIMSAIAGPLFGVIQRRYPETADENLSRPRFIYVGTDTEAQTGVLLTEKEQQRLIGFVRDSLDSIREDAAPVVGERPKPQALHKAAESVGNEVSAYIGELIDSSPPRETVERLTALRTAQGLLDELADEVYGLVMHLGEATAAASLEPSIGSMVESLHLVTTMLLDELASPDEFQRTSLVTMTSNRSEMVEGLRRELTHGHQALTTSEQETLLTVTTNYERAMLLVQRYLALMPPAS